MKIHTKETHAELGHSWQQGRDGTFCSVCGQWRDTVRHHVMLTVHWNTIFIECTCGWSASAGKPAQDVVDIVTTIPDLFTLGWEHVAMGKAMAELN